MQQIKIEMDDWPEFVKKFRKQFKGFFRNQTLCDIAAKAIWDFGNKEWRKGFQKRSKEL